MNVRSSIVSIFVVLLVGACDGGQPQQAAQQAQAPDPNLKNCKDYGKAATVSVAIHDAAAGDSVKGEFICGDLGVMTECTATVAAGANSANCVSPPFDVSGFDKEQTCPATVMAGVNPPHSVTCSN